MNNLKLPSPKMMDEAVAANMRIGLNQNDVARKGWAVSGAEAVALHLSIDVTMVDLREEAEREKVGIIPDSMQARYPNLTEHINAGGEYTDWRRRPANE